jgi:uncharacterized membrane protein HdeD (DUF308 family)
MGGLSILVGIIVLAKPSDSLSTLAVIFGIFVLIDGIGELVGALVGGTQNRGLLALIGVLSVIAGVLLIRHPLGGVRAVALVLGLWLAAAGVVRFVAVFDGGGHVLWRISVALILLIVGIVVVADPNIGYATLALITGIGLVCHGVAMMLVGWALHHVRHEGLAPIDDVAVPT